MTIESHNREQISLAHPSDVALAEEIRSGEDHNTNIAKLRLLWQERRFLGRLLLYGLVGSLLLAFLIPTRYESTVRLMPPDQSSAGLTGMLNAFAAKSGLDTGGNLGGLAGVASDALGLKTSSDLFIGILESRTVEDHIIKKFDLQRVYWDRRIEDARIDLEKRTDIASDRKSGIITIKITDHSPLRAADIGREYIDQLNWVLVNLNTSAAHRERIFLGNRLSQVRQDLEVAETNFGQFSSKNATLDIKQQGIAMVEASATLEGQLIAAQTQLEGLKQIYSDNNVRVRTVQARIDELKRQLQKLGGKSGIDVGRNDQYVDSLYPTIRNLPIIGVTYADLYRQTKVDESTFEMLTEEYELAKVEEAKELPSVKVLDQPDIPGKKSFPPRTVIVVLGTFMTVLSGILFTFVLESWRSIDPHDPGKQLASEIWIQLKENRIWHSKNGSARGSVLPSSRNGNCCQDDRSDHQ